MDSCDRYQQMISAGLDETVATDKQFELDSHIATCDDCRVFLKSSLNVRSALSSAPFQSPTRMTLSTPRQTWWKRTVTVPVPLAAAVVVILAAGWLLPSNSRVTPVSLTAPYQTIEQAEDEVIVLEPVSAVLVSTSAPSLNIGE